MGTGRRPALKGHHFLGLEVLSLDELARERHSAVHVTSGNRSTPYIWLAGLVELCILLRAARASERPAVDGRVCSMRRDVHSAAGVLLPLSAWPRSETAAALFRASRTVGKVGGARGAS